MNIATTAVVDVLTFLLPGFIAAGVYFALTPSPRPIPFERIVQALIFTMVVHAFLFVLSHMLYWIGHQTRFWGTWTSDVRLTWSVVTALLLGLALAWSTNRDKVHAVLRKMGITDQTSYASEWYGALCQNKGFVVLHLKGARRLYGWPEEWPSVSDRGHFVMAKAEWLDGGKQIALSGVKRILVRADEVEMVELMHVLNGSYEEKQNG